MKVNIEELTRKLNEFRMSTNKTFTGQELADALYGLGFNKVTCWSMNKYFPFEKIGSSKLFSMPKEPIHKSAVAAVYNSSRSSKERSMMKKVQAKCSALSEQDAISILQKAGYELRKCVGFDLEKFAREQPIMYKRYLKYENI